MSGEIMKEAILNRVREMAAKPGMSYTKIGQFIGVDPKKAKELCQEAGVEPNRKKAQNGESKIGSLENQVQELSLDIDSLKKMVEALRKPEEADTNKLNRNQLREEIINISQQLQEVDGNVFQLLKEDREFMTALVYLVSEATEPLIKNLQNQLNRHHHVVLSIDASREWSRQRRMNGNG